MELILVRHGESESNIGATTNKDSALTPLGHLQADRAGQVLQAAGIERLYCSPMQRALQTGAALSHALSLPVHAWVELSEHGLAWDSPGLSRSEIARRFPMAVLPAEVDEEGWARHWTGETREELRVRMRTVADRLLAMAAEGTPARVACVIHGGSGCDLLRVLLRIEQGAPVWLDHTNCGITRLTINENGEVALTSLNERHHLTGLPEQTQRMTG